MCVRVYVCMCALSFTRVVIDNSAYRFRVDNHFLFVSRKNATGNKAADERSRRLYVTDNYISEKVRFVEVQLPSLLDEQVGKDYFRKGFCFSRYRMKWKW